jgi:purine-binding chemotaxis protein CheW
VLGRESFALELSRVCEVFAFESMTPVPDMPPMLVGVVNFHGTIVPLADLRSLLGVPSSSTPRYAVIVRYEDQQIGIVVNEVPEIVTIEAGEMLDGLPGESARHRPFLSGVLKMRGRVSGLVEISKLVAMLEGTLDQQPA